MRGWHRSPHPSLTPRSPSQALGLTNHRPFTNQMQWLTLTSAVLSNPWGLTYPLTAGQTKQTGAWGPHSGFSASNNPLSLFYFIQMTWQHREIRKSQFYENSADLADLCLGVQEPAFPPGAKQRPHLCRASLTHVTCPSPRKSPGSGVLAVNKAALQLR